MGGGKGILGIVFLFSVFITIALSWMMGIRGPYMDSA